MKFSAVLFASLLTSAAAFVPQTSPNVAFVPTALSMSDAPAADKAAVVVDENFDDVNLVRILGLNRVKKIMRRHKREAAKKAAAEPEE